MRVTEMLENSLGDRSAVARKKGRSAMTNGAILPGVDGRSIWARRLRDLVALHVADLGGDQNISESERAIIRRAAVIICELERMERGFALGEGAPGIPDLETYQRMANTMRRLLEALGLQRRQRDVTPSLREYLDARATETVTGESESVPPTQTAPESESRTGPARARPGDAFLSTSPVPSEPPG
jgi:hypothetical protein